MTEQAPSTVYPVVHRWPDGTFVVVRSSHDECGLACLKTMRARRGLETRVDSLLKLFGESEEGLI